MKRVMNFVTLDGTVHLSRDAALRHLGELEGKIITAHAHCIVHLTKYLDVSNYIERNIEDLARIMTIRADARFDDGIDVTEEDD